MSGVTKYGISAAGTDFPPPVNKLGIGPVTFGPTGATGAEVKGACGVGGVMRLPEVLGLEGRLVTGFEKSENPPTFGSVTDKSLSAE